MVVTRSDRAAHPVRNVKIEDVNDSRIIRKLDESGFIDRAFAAQGMSLK
jgi:hypothetical protein